MYKFLNRNVIENFLMSRDKNAPLSPKPQGYDFYIIYNRKTGYAIVNELAKVHCHAFKGLRFWTMMNFF